MGYNLPTPKRLMLETVTIKLNCLCTVQGGGNDTVYLEGSKDTVILGSSGTATIYGFDKKDSLDVSGLNAPFTRSGNDMLINSGSTSLGVLKGYTGPVSVV